MENQPVGPLARVRACAPGCLDLGQEICFPRGPRHGPLKPKQLAASSHAAALHAHKPHHGPGPRKRSAYLGRATVQLILCVRFHSMVTR
jgi:hypothetical protein